MADPVLGPVANGDTFKITFFQTLYNQNCMNVLHYVCNDPGITPPDRYQVCKQLVDFLDTTNLIHDLQVVQSADVQWTGVRCQFQKEIDSTYPFYQKVLTSAGAVAVPAGTANMSASIEKRAIVTDPTKPRQGIGRLAVLGIPVGSYTGGLLDTLYKADYANLLEDMVDLITLASGPQLSPCLSYKGATNWLDNIIFAVELHPEVRDMTRRTVGRGQ